MPSEMNAIVDNRSGAGGDIGVTDAARAAPDGKTVLLHTSSLVINAVFRGKSSETEHMFEPIARVGDVKFVLVIQLNFLQLRSPSLSTSRKTGGVLATVLQGREPHVRLLPRCSKRQLAFPAYISPIAG